MRSNQSCIENVRVKKGKLILNIQDRGKSGNWREEDRHTFHDFSKHLFKTFVMMYNEILTYFVLGNYLDQWRDESEA